ncbi:hypothetical protein AA313_de0208123 [Arthrobotrys entomopaga]|nr:hypothetical protein AA313_de0208123 [Arthrobotrys entomopaga]
MNALRLPRLWISPFARLYHSKSHTHTPIDVCTIYALTKFVANQLMQFYHTGSPRGALSHSQSLLTTGESPIDTNPNDNPVPPRDNPTLKKAQNLPYSIIRTKSNNLPIYRRYTKSGATGTVTIKKIVGDKHALANDLSKHLTIPRDFIKIREPTGQLELRTKDMDALVNYFEERQLGLSSESIEGQGRRRALKKVDKSVEAEAVETAEKRGLDEGMEGAEAESKVTEAI